MINTVPFWVEDFPCPPDLALSDPPGEVDVAVVGGGNSATEESLFLLKFVDRVTMLVRGGELTASQILQEKVLSHGRIDVRFHTEAIAFHGKGGKLTNREEVHGVGEGIPV